MEITTTKKLISIKELDKYSSINSLIISDNLKNFQNFKIFSFDEFCEYIIKKSPSLFLPKILSTEESEVLLYSILKDLFKEHPIMHNLTKSTACAKEFHHLFKSFYKLNLTPKELLLAIKDSNFSDIDEFNRLNLIAKTYDTYNEKLKNENLLDKSVISNFTLNLLEKHSQLLDITKQNCETIFIDNNLILSPVETKLLEKITLNINLIETSEKKQNIIAQAISEKYLNTPLTFEKAQNKLNILKFNDIKEEAQYITSTILNKIEKENYLLNDFIIAINDTNALKIINDTLTQVNIPTNYEFVDELFLNFIVKLNQYLNICYNLELLKNTNKSKAKEEEIYEELNMYFENIISETLNNQFIKDKFLSLLQPPNNLNLIDCVRNNLDILNYTDKEKIFSVIEKIEKLSNLYSREQYAEFIGLTIQGEELNTNAKQKIAKLIKQIVSIKNILKERNNKKINFQSIQEMLLSLTKPKPNNNDNCIKFLSIKAAQSQYSKILFIPSLTENSIPYNKNSVQFISQETNTKISNELRKKYPEFKNIIPSQADEIKESAKYLVNILCQGQEEIIFSTHNYEDKKQIIPSIFFQYINSIIEIIEPKLSAINETKKEEDLIQNHPSITDKKEPIIGEANQLKLSPSAISTFQSCPRKYYFANLLGLKTTSTFSASYGTIAHAILELFNQNYLKSYNKETILNLTEILFNANTEQEKALSTGFSSRTIDLIKATDLLSLEEMKVQFLDAINELEKNNFFNKIPDEIISEKPFQFKHPLLENIVFEGRIDAIYKYEDNYTIIDFKTGADKPKLSYLISENGVNFKTPTGKDTNIETKQNEYEYQIPIYYLATQYSDNFKELRNKINSIGLLYIRPKNRHDGYKEDIINCEIIKEFEEKLIQNLKETIIDKIKNKEYFESKANSIICSNCAFKNLCETNSEVSDD